MAKVKGDIQTLIEGAHAIDTLKDGDSVLIAESCTHHALEGDIARQKLPNWLNKKVGGMLNFEVSSGISFPENLKKYQLILHCGASMINRRQMLWRIEQAKDAGVPITNFGTAIAKLNGILDNVVY